MLNAKNAIVSEAFDYKVDIPHGAAEPHECTFANLGDYNVKTKPDTIRFSVKAKPHPRVDRQGHNLYLRDAISMSPHLFAEPYISMRAESLQGRLLCIWGRNPFFLAKGGANVKLRVRIQGEGLHPLGHLEIVCQLGATGDSIPKPQPFTRESARTFLQAVVKSGEAATVRSKLEQARKLWEKNEYLLAQDIVIAAWDEVFRNTGDVTQHHAMRERLEEAMRCVEGEWSLLAKVSSMVSSWPRPDSISELASRESISAKQFLDRHCPPGDGFHEPDSLDGEDDCPVSDVIHGKGGLHESAAIHNLISRRRTRDLFHDFHLSPINESVAMGIAPDCKLQLYSDKEQSVFAVTLFSQECARKKSTHIWERLKESVAPLVQSTIFGLMHIARSILPRQIPDFKTIVKLTSESTASSLSAVLKCLGNDAYRRGEFFLAADLYSRCLEQDNSEKDFVAIVLSNRAACSAKVGLFEESMADAKKATELRPAWARAWSRVGAAADRLEIDSHGQEACDAWFKAVELDAAQDTVDGLYAAARKVLVADKSMTNEEKAKGDDAARKECWGLAIAHYTLAIVLMGEVATDDVTKQSKEDLPLWSSLHANRAAAYTRLRLWQAAIADATIAVATNQSSVKARTRLGTALMAAGLVERAYISFSQAVWMDATNVAAMKAQEACLCMLPLWKSKAAIARKAACFNKDSTRPRESTRVYAISDVHFDKDGNDQWISALDSLAFQEDVLIVAGNLAQSIGKILHALQTLKSKFRRVFYVPGNNEMWLNANEQRVHQFADSLSKLIAIMERCDEIGVDVFPARICADVTVIPLLSWYNAEFEGEKSAYGKQRAQADLLAKWSLDPATQVWKYMLRLNEVHLERPPPGTVITFSHFLPSTQLPMGKQEDAKAMGCEDLEDQMLLVKSHAHVYGHSTYRTVEQHGRTWFFNNNCVSETNQDPKPLLIFDGSKGICKERPEDMVAHES